MPTFLYKILSLENWNKSQSKTSLVLSKDDKEFIHLATDDQLEKIIHKYWNDASEFVVLKVDVHLLLGELVYESNPGGSNKYYHLYSGSIPLKAVLEAKVVQRKS